MNEMKGYENWCSRLSECVSTLLELIRQQYEVPRGISLSHAPAVCKWMLCVLNRAVIRPAEYLDADDYENAAYVVYHFWDKEIIGVFMEDAKIYAGDPKNMYYVRRTHTGLRIMHPLRKEYN